MRLDGVGHRMAGRQQGPSRRGMHRSRRSGVFDTSAVACFPGRAPETRPELIF